MQSIPMTKRVGIGSTVFVSSGRWIAPEARDIAIGRIGPSRLEEPVKEQRDSSTFG
jgi:hypothetical protein